MRDEELAGLVQRKLRLLPGSIESAYLAKHNVSAGRLRLANLTVES